MARWARGAVILMALAASGCGPLFGVEDADGVGGASGMSPGQAPGDAPNGPGEPPPQEGPDPTGPENPPDPVPRARCAPTAGGPLWLEEGEPLDVVVRCATGLTGGAISFESVHALPPGASLDPATGHFSWTPGLDQAAVYTVTLRERSTGEEVAVKIGVADRFDDSENEPLADPARYTEELGLPVFHLQFEELDDKEYRPATLVYRGRTYVIEAKLRGASSLEFPKNSYTLKFPDTGEFRDPLVGFGNRDKLVLVTAFNDNSGVRTRLAFELWSLMDPGHLDVKTFSAVVFANGEYLGLYTASDHVDSDMMRRQGLAKAGNLYKAVNGDANFSRYDRDGGSKSSLHQGYEKKSGLPEEGTPGAFADLVDLTDFVISAGDAEFRQRLPQLVHLPDYQDWWIFVTTVLATDSPGKNAYHYHDPAGGPFRYIPWDLDASFGQNWNTTRTRAQSSATFDDRNELFRRLLEEPEFAGPMRARLTALLQNELRVDRVLALLDVLHAEVHAAAERDQRRWRGDYLDYKRWSSRSDFEDHEGELEYMRQWITARWERLLNEPP